MASRNCWLEREGKKIAHLLRKASEKLATAKSSSGNCNYLNVDSDLEPSLRKANKGISATSRGKDWWLSSSLVNEEKKLLVGVCGTGPQAA